VNVLPSNQALGLWFLLASLTWLQPGPLLRAFLAFLDLRLGFATRLDLVKVMVYRQTARWCLWPQAGPLLLPPLLSGRGRTAVPSLSTAMI